jgi:hypothetical protein
LEEDWLCGADCLEQVLRLQITDLLSSARPPETPRPARVPLGLMLFSRGYLNEDQFKAALDGHRQSGARLGDVALQLGFVSEEQVAAALAGQWGYPVFSFKNAPPELPSLVPVHLMELHQMLPIQFVGDGRKVLVGFATRVEHSMIYGMERMLRCSVSPCFITVSEFRARIRTLSLKRRETEFIFDRVASHLEMAQIVKSYVLQTSAVEISLALCREYLWARVAGASQALDLLFKLDIPQT